MWWQPQERNSRPLSCLFVYQAIDIPLRFPQLFEGSNDVQGLDSCRVVCSDVEHWELSSVISSLKHGYSIDWDAAKRHWSQHPITDPGAFALLLSVWPAALQELMKPITSSAAATQAEASRLVREDQDAQVQAKLLRNIRVLLNVGDAALAKRCLLLAPDGRSLTEVQRAAAVLCVYADTVFASVFAAGQRPALAALHCCMEAVPLHSSAPAC